MDYRIWNDVDRKMENKIVQDKHINPWTGLYDGDGQKIYLGDIVEMNGFLYKIAYERGAFAICTLNSSYTIDYELFEAFKQIAFDDEDLVWEGTRNDYIMPLWDLFDNFCYADKTIDCFKVQGNIIENKDLLSFTVPDDLLFESFEA